jgi:ABC-type multidrug transport system fused ATPase/permease subunit
MRFDDITRHAIAHTSHCLVGCGIGEVLGSVIGASLSWSNILQTVLSTLLAFIFGYGLTYFGARRSGTPAREARNTALRTDTVSIISMELVDNSLLYILPGVMSAAVLSWLFWGGLALSLATAFVITVPVNRWMMTRYGIGHHH